MFCPETRNNLVAAALACLGKLQVQRGMEGLGEGAGGGGAGKVHSSLILQSAALRAAFQLERESKGAGNISGRDQMRAGGIEGGIPGERGLTRNITCQR